MLRALVLVERDIAPPQRHRRAVDRGERRAQLVGDRRDELRAHRLERPLLGQVAEGVDDAVRHGDAVQREPQLARPEVERQRLRPGSRDHGLVGDRDARRDVRPAGDRLDGGPVEHVDAAAGPLRPRGAVPRADAAVGGRRRRRRRRPRPARARPARALQPRGRASRCRSRSRRAGRGRARTRDPRGCTCPSAPPRPRSWRRSCGRARRAEQTGGNARRSPSCGSAGSQLGPARRDRLTRGVGEARIWLAGTGASPAVASANATTLVPPRRRGGRRTGRRTRRRRAHPGARGPIPRRDLHRAARSPSPGTRGGHVLVRRRCRGWRCRPRRRPAPRARERSRRRPS